jgi:hypothetical protein
MDQTGFMPGTNASASQGTYTPPPKEAYGYAGTMGTNVMTPGNPFNSGFSTCSSMSQL